MILTWLLISTYDSFHMMNVYHFCLRKHLMNSLWNIQITSIYKDHYLSIYLETLFSKTKELFILRFTEELKLNKMKPVFRFCKVQLFLGKSWDIYPIFQIVFFNLIISYYIFFSFHESNIFRSKLLLDSLQWANKALGALLCQRSLLYSFI